MIYDNNVTPRSLLIFGYLSAYSFSCCLFFRTWSKVNNVLSKTQKSQAEVPFIQDTNLPKLPSQFSLSNCELTKEGNLSRQGTFIQKISSLFIKSPALCLCRLRWLLFLRLDPTWRFHGRQRHLGCGANTEQSRRSSLNKIGMTWSVIPPVSLLSCYIPFTMHLRDGKFSSYFLSLSNK